MYTDIISMWNTYYINSIRKLDQYLHHFSILFAYYSCKLDNSEIELSEAKEVFLKGRQAKLDCTPIEFLDLYNQYLCYQYLKDKIVSRTPITKQLICDIHALLMAGLYDETYCIAQNELPGRFRVHNYKIRSERIGCDYDEIEQQLDSLLVEINDHYSLNEALINATQLLAEFDKIHPFADGNGRVGRMLLNYYLLIHDNPPTILFHDDRTLYFDYLKSYVADGNLVPLYEFLKCETEKTWKKTYLSFKKDNI